ncbi:MAG: S41 family peptidase [Chloroflexota bacterium]
MTPKKKIFIIGSVLILASLACQSFSFNGNANSTTNNDNNGDFQPNLVPAIPAGQLGQNEPVFVTGTIPFTSPSFTNSTAEPFVMLEDQAGFVARDRDFVFSLAGQSIGPVEQTGENELSFSLALPTVPQATLVDVDNNGEDNQGVMIFAVAYWSNTWGGPFLEEREGTGWSGAYASTQTDPDRDYEINGGYLIIWAPDNQQSFPTEFGADNMLFTADDPVTAVPAGYSIIDLNTQPFTIEKEANPEFVLNEGTGEVKDYSELSYSEAFDTMFEKVAIEYPFTQDKNIDWDGLYKEFSPIVSAANNEAEFFRAINEFGHNIPDAHVNVSFDANVFYEDFGGSFGIRMAELTDGRVIVVEVLPDTTGAGAGIIPGAEIINWDGMPITEALNNVNPRLGSHSTIQHERQDKLIFLTRYPIDTTIEITFHNPGSNSKDAAIKTEVEYDSLFNSLAYFNLDPVSLPVEGYTLESGFGFIQIQTFSDDYNLMAQVWERHIKNLIDEEIPGLIIDLRTNFGGSVSLSTNFANYFFDEEITISISSYYNHELGVFEDSEYPATIEPAPLHYEGPIVLLISPNCISACEGFAYRLLQKDRAITAGHFGTAGAYGEVSRGRYKLPGEIDVQFPTGRAETPDGDLLIEGVGILPELMIPITFDSAMGITDPVLDAAIEYLNDITN